MGRSDYGPEEVSNFREQIVEYVVPIASKLQEQKKDILGLDKLYFYDGINFKDGDPKPKGSPEHLVNAAQEMYHELSPETGKFFDTMVSEELMDLVNRDGKRPGGFCTSFPKYNRPYIFSNFNGTDHDITVLTHEAGHALIAKLFSDIFVVKLKFDNSMFTLSIFLFKSSKKSVSG